MFLSPETHFRRAASRVSVSLPVSVPPARANSDATFCCVLLGVLTF